MYSNDPTLMVKTRRDELLREARKQQLIRQVSPSPASGRKAHAILLAGLGQRLIQAGAELQSRANVERTPTPA
jgi:hypothetical protein